MSEQWYEVVERGTGAVEHECIIFCGPLDACVMNLVNDNSHDLIIRPISF